MIAQANKFVAQDGGLGLKTLELIESMDPMIGVAVIMVMVFLGWGLRSIYLHFQFAPSKKAVKEFNRPRREQICPHCSGSIKRELAMAIEKSTLKSVVYARCSYCKQVSSWDAKSDPPQPI